MKDISKQYTLLAPDERFRLFVEAVGRRDEQELDRLESTCPRLHYSSQDYAYRIRKMSFTILALTTALRNSRNDTVCLFGLIASLDDDDEQSARACRLFQQLMRMRRARREGWVRFCRQIGVDPDAITKPFIEGTEWTMKTAEAVFEDLESEAVEESDDAAPIADREFAVFMDAWSDRTDNG